MLRFKRVVPPLVAFLFAAACGAADPPPPNPNVAGPNFPPGQAKGGTVVDTTGASSPSNSRSCAKKGSGADSKCGGVLGDDVAAGKQDCCETRIIPGGTYNRFNDPKYPATVSSFRLDTFLVTAGRFRAWVDEMKGDLKSSSPPPGAGANPKIPNSGWRTEWNIFLPQSRVEVDRMFSREDDVEGNLACQFGSNIYEYGALTWWNAQLDKEIKDSTKDAQVLAENTKDALDRKPINCIPWHVLFAFCIWDGGRLPTDAEFGYAAAGGSEQRAFAWGNVDEGDLVHFFDRDDLSLVPTYAAGKKFVAARLWDPPNLKDGSKPEDYSFTWGTAQFGEPNDVHNAAHIMPVGRRPAGNGKWGQADLAGNMYEWMLDEGPIRPGACKDCANVDFPKPSEFDPKVPMTNPDFENKTDRGVNWYKGGARSIRGGGWDNPAMLANKQSQVEIEQYTAYPLLRTYRALGGRCARNN